ncbi:hypothetical protein F5Y16DRAFT_55182 [Xylariaceae sp. FL0255]|nr:hypothetical protein F5Y16DRAFT_55182 [Xylariaceae sp. FL0255]
MKSEVEPDPLDHPIYRTISPSLRKVQSVPQPRAPELVVTPLPRLSQRAIIQSNNNNNQIPVGHIQGNHLVYENRNFRSKQDWNFSISFSVLCLVNLIWAIDSSALPVIFPAIAKDLDGLALQGFWAGTSPLLASTTSQLL